jgi:hypothetical protein
LGIIVGLITWTSSLCAVLKGMAFEIKRSLADATLNHSGGDSAAIDLIQVSA